MRVIDEIETDLSELVAADFGHFKGKKVHAHFLDWLHYKARNIPPRPRSVLVSDEIAARSQQFPAIGRICANLREGADMSPWLSARIHAKKSKHSADMMFNDWQIGHFHLGTFFETSKSVRRTAALLFAHITSEEVTLLDVQPHGAWTQTKLLEILLKTNPTAGYQLRGMTTKRLTDQEHQNLRANRVNAVTEIDGKAFMPGMGITSSGHALRITNYEMWFWRQAKHLKKQFTASVVAPHLEHVYYTTLGIPVRLGVWYDPNGLAIIDKNRNNLVLHQMKPIE